MAVGASCFDRNVIDGKGATAPPCRRSIGPSANHLRRAFVGLRDIRPDAFDRAGSIVSIVLISPLLRYIRTSSRGTASRVSRLLLQKPSKCLAKHRPLRAVRSRSARCPSMVRLVGSDRAWNTASIASLNQSLKRSSRRGNDPPTVDRADRPQERKRELKPRRNKAQRQDRECSGRRRRRRRPARCTACHR
jgi:hypothetical protein